jgi:hypothetical protein
MMRWFAEAFRYLLMSRTERYLAYAIDRSDFERRLRSFDGEYYANKSDLGGRKPAPART